MKEGKFLEILAECLHKVLATDDIKVLRNQKYYNKAKRLIGEVDVVIEGWYQSKFIKIGTECRDRNSPQDRNWIRQIIGKREDLAEYGFTDWVAISRYGFKSTAIELADKTNIRLLIPAKIEPKNPAKSGPHKWSQFTMSMPQYELGEFSATIQYNSENISEKRMDFLEQKVIKNKFAIITEQGEISFIDFIKPHAESYLQKISETNESKEFKKLKLFKFDSLNIKAANEKLILKNVRTKIKFQKINYINNFSSIAFVIPRIEKVLGIIFINEYLKNEKTAIYLLVGINPSKIDEPILMLRNSDGNIIPNQKINFILPNYSKEVIKSNSLKMIRFRGR